MCDCRKCQFDPERLTDQCHTHYCEYPTERRCPNCKCQFCAGCCPSDGRCIICQEYDPE